MDAGANGTSSPRRAHRPAREGGNPRFKRYLDEQKGRPTRDVGEDISPINSQVQERPGYPTQKPITLLERILAASSNAKTRPRPFCGCGTTVHAARARPALDWDRHHPSGYRPDSTPTHRAFPGDRHPGRSRDRRGRRRLAESGQAPVPALGPLHGGGPALQRRPEGRGRRRRRLHLLQARRQAHREGHRLGQGRRARLRHDGEGPYHHRWAREGGHGRLHHPHGRPPAP